MDKLRSMLPVLNNFTLPRPQSRLEEEIRAKWNPNIRAAGDDKNNVITIYEVIGEDWLYYSHYSMVHNPIRIKWKLMYFPHFTSVCNNGHGPVLRCSELTGQKRTIKSDKLLLGILKEKPHSVAP